ncbi:COG4705 family protein [Terrabacter terrigena]|uniref:Membrane-anchored protein n=1 Tax=Terrabacter terrigena TaxID=574718 RepID=A0ABW3N2I2_9MICO
MPGSVSTALDRARPMSGSTLLNKVPAITATFWLIKVLSTTIGETFADYLAVDVGLGTAATDGAMVTLLAVALVAQLRAKRLVPWLYWLTVVLVSIVGTQITDFFTDTLGVSLYVSTAAFSVVLAVVFTLWWRQERTLAITAIDTPRRERYYWGAILTTFALGTAGGDLATEALSLGFRNGALIFGGLILAVWLGRRLGLDAVLAFWIAYVLTRPLGASLGDLLTQDRDFGGLGLGASRTSLLFLGVIIALVAREQVNANRHGIRAKGEAPAVSPHRDYVWAAAAAVAVVAAAFVLAPAPTPAAAAPAAGTGADAGKGRHVNPLEADATSPIGDLRPFAVIVDDVAGRTKAGDLAGATARIKDLEVAWDNGEAAMKPASPDDWHSLDSAIDGALTALRATPPTKQSSLSALTALQSTIGALEKKQ